MKKNILLFIAFFAVLSSAFSQEPSRKIAVKDIERINAFVIRQYKKNAKKPVQEDSAKIIHTFIVDYSEFASLTKNHFENGQFLRYISPTYRKKGRKQLLCTETIIVGSDRENIGYLAEEKFSMMKSDWILGIAKAVIEHEIEYLYQLEGMGGTFRVGIDSQNQVYIIEEYCDNVNNTNCVDSWLIQDFPDEDWPRVFPNAYSRVGIDIFNTKMYKARFP
ncbi:MAG: hypothetical protein MJZ91_02940 [Bacteroidales bacterium]|nr:hypothetical protein [Bacteroidales bacterium]